MDSSRGEYKTKQRELILSLLIDAAKSHNSHITADKLAQALKGSVGKTTIYRNLEKLISEGVVIKYDAPAGAFGACYRYVGHNNSRSDECGLYHFLCTGCGAIHHLDCEKIDDLSLHVERDHGMSLDMRKTVFYGACKNCKK